jgi:hypothetical protein
MLMVEAPLCEVVDLSFILPYGSVQILATVRQRSAFRYGFEFVDHTAVPEVIRHTCRDLAVDQSLLSPKHLRRESPLILSLQKMFGSCFQADLLGA